MSCDKKEASPVDSDRSGLRLIAASVLEAQLPSNDRRALSRMKSSADLLRAGKLAFAAAALRGAACELQIDREMVGQRLRLL